MFVWKKPRCCNFSLRKREKSLVLHYTQYYVVTCGYAVASHSLKLKPTIRHPLLFQFRCVRIGSDSSNVRVLCVFAYLEAESIVGYVERYWISSGVEYFVTSWWVFGINYMEWLVIARKGFLKQHAYSISYNHLVFT